MISFQPGRFAVSSRHGLRVRRGADVCVRLAVYPSALSGTLGAGPPPWEGGSLPHCPALETSQVTSALMSLDMRGMPLAGAAAAFDLC